MIRTALAILAGVLVVTAATAQSGDEIIKKRQALMKRSGDMAKLGASMVRGDTPFDKAKADQIFGAFADKAAQLPNLFPENTKTGGDTHAAPAIWEKSDEFKAKIAKFASDVKNAQASDSDLASFKTSFAAVGGNCRGCHETFRTKMN